jgi:hypothetical protein
MSTKQLCITSVKRTHAYTHIHAYKYTYIYICDYLSKGIIWIYIVVRGSDVTYIENTASNYFCMLDHMTPKRRNSGAREDGRF